MTSFRILKSVAAASAMLVAVPSFAQTAQPTAPQSASEAPVDPARLAAAKPVIDQIWPMGTYARLMHGMMEQMSQGMLANMYGMRAEDLAPDAKSAKAAGGKTLGEMMAEDDPYYQQRMQITMRVMFDEMGRLMTEVEPQVRDGLAHSYARHFSVDQLNDLHRFFATPTGKAYAADSMMLMMGPDMMKAMQSFAPRMFKAMPAIMAKVQEATKDLPPPKTKTPAK